MMKKTGIKWGLLALFFLALEFPDLFCEGALAADFDTIEFRIEPFQGQNQSLTIHANGTCVYKNEGRPGYPHDPKPWPAKTWYPFLGAHSAVTTWRCRLPGLALDEI